jgi:hypothetical protein
MRAQSTWSRTAVGGAGLAADALPGAPAGDNVVPIPSLDSGRSPTGIAIGWTGPAGTASVSVIPYAWSDDLSQWLQLSAAIVVPNGFVLRVRTPIPGPLFERGTGARAQGTRIALALEGDAAAADGTYRFVALADYSVA